MIRSNYSNLRRINMDIDYLVMLSILQLHRGKSIKYVDGKMSDVTGINDISVNNVYSYLISTYNSNIDINDLNESINRLQTKGHLHIEDGRLCPSNSLIHYFVEILQYEEDKKECLRMLSSKISMIENQNNKPTS
jgi:hypothetical protein